MSISNFQKHQALLLLLSFLFLLVVSVVGDYNKSGDSEILIQVRNSGLDDPEGSLDNWVVNSEYNACNWTGITCDDRHVSVVSIDLSGFGLSGGFPFELCRIRTLRNLSLSDNSINGSLLSSSLSLCSHLQVLNLSSNYLVGELPDFSPEFSELRVIDLSFNNFSGEIPASFCRFPKLRVLKLIENLLNGSIPAFLGNLSELTRLELAQNPFQESHLPSEIGNLSKLDNLFLPNTNLIGPIPESIGKLVSLRNLDLSSNRLSGEVPETIGGLIKVEQILLFANQISGEIPVSLANLSNLRTLDVSLNSLTGKLHEKIAAMPLEYVNLNDNFLEGEIPQVFASNPKLRSVKLFNNSFSGTLPANLGRYAELEEFDVSTNKFAGNLPEYLCYGKKLQRIVAFNNGFSGVVPESYGECISLSYIRIENNELSGKLPDSFWNLPMLEYLGLRNNGFKGSVPPSIFKARGLTVVTVSGNNFSGTLPDQLCKLRNLVKFDVSGNNFFGEIPSCITELKNLQKLDLQENNFSGIIPSTVSSWTVLTELNLSGNRLSGQIPYQLGDLPVLTYLDLSRNILSGQIPIELTKLKLNQFNVSVNKLYGRVPTGFDHELFLASLMGNLNLCSPDLKPLPPCRKPKQVALYVIITLSITALVLIGSLLWVVKSKFYVFNGKRMKPWKVAAFQRIRFNEEDIIPHLTSRNLIGEGGSGRVYRVCLKPGHVVAVKRLWSGKKEADAELVFQSEVGSLGQVRHINIVKLLCSLSDGEDNRILVYEYMENGSLGDALHGHSDSNLLDWQTRFDIAVGTAQGLAYLHHDCVPAIVHRDIKSNNVLLDEEFRPKLADFGLAKTLQREGDPTRDAMSRVVGSYGYIAPEYAYTMKVTEKSDVYSFGVVLMEMVTGKRPNDAFFGDNGDIVKWVRGTALSCFAEENGKEEVHCSDVENLRDPRMKLFTCDFEQIERVLNVALLCTSTLPINRPSMKRVVELLKGQKL